MQILQFKTQRASPGYAMVLGLLIASVTAISTAGLFSVSKSINKRLQPKVGAEQLRQDVRASLEIAIKDLTTDDAFSTVNATYWNTESLYEKLHNLTDGMGVTDPMFADICGPALGSTFEDRFTSSSIVDNQHDLCTDTGLEATKNSAPKIIGSWQTNDHRIATFVSLVKPGDDCPSPKNVTFLVASCGFSGGRVNDVTDSSLDISNIAIEIAEVSRRAGVWNLVTWERR